MRKGLPLGTGLRAGDRLGTWEKSRLFTFFGIFWAFNHINMLPI